MFRTTDEGNQKVVDAFRHDGTSGPMTGFLQHLVLLHHVGARSGTERVNPVTCIRQDANTWLIVAANSGATHHPAWYYNLIAHPDIAIETRDEGIVSVHVQELHGVERDLAWQHFKDFSSMYQQFEHSANRVIPIFALTRR